MRFKAHMPRRRPGEYARPAPNSRLANAWENAILFAMVALFVGLATLLIHNGQAGSPPVNAAMPPMHAVEPPPSPFDGLPETPEAIERAKAEAEAAFRAAWAPKTLPRTSNAAGHIMALTDCDDRCQRQNARLDKQEAKAFDRLIDGTDRKHDRRKHDRHDRRR